MINSSSLTYQQKEQIDDLIIRKLNQTRKKVEGLRRNVPYSDEKIKRIRTIGFQKLKIRQLKGELIDKDLMDTKKEKYALEVPKQVSIQEAKVRLRRAKEEQKKWKNKGIRKRKKELLDLYPKEIDEEQISEKKQKKILKGIKNRLMRHTSFKYISKHIGKGERGSLKRLYELDENNQITKTSVSKEEIESAIIQHNYKYY